VEDLANALAPGGGPLSDGGHERPDAYRVRESVLVAVEADAGWRGLGEASLPPGASFREHGAEIDAFMVAASQRWPGVRHPRLGGLRLPAHVPGEWSPRRSARWRRRWLTLPRGRPGCRCTAGSPTGAGIPLDTEAPGIEVNGLVDLLEPVAAARAAAGLVRAGFRTVKLKVGGDPEHSIATVAAVRMAAGPDVELRCDANRSWGVLEARSFLAGAARYAVALCEEPLADPATATSFSPPCERYRRSRWRSMSRPGRWSGWSA